MKNMTDSYFGEHLKSALSQMVPNKIDEIWEQPVEKAKGDEWFLDGLNKHFHSAEKLIKFVSAMAACFLVGIFSYYMIVLNPQATVYLDVNPSIQFEVNSREKVISAEAANMDGKQILEDMDLRHTDLDIALNAIIGSMVKHGYLDEDEDMILVSVDSMNPHKGELLRTDISEEISSCLDSFVGSASVFDQEVSVDKNLRALAEEYGITPGKASLIQKLTEENPKLEYGELAVLPIRELVERLEHEGIDLREYANYTGDGYDPEEMNEDKEELLEELRERESELHDDDQDDDKDDPIEVDGDRNEENITVENETEAPENHDVPEIENDIPEQAEPEYEESDYEAPEQEYEEPEYDVEEEDD